MLELHSDKPKVVHLSNESLKFLIFVIGSIDYSKYRKKYVRLMKKGSRRHVQARLSMGVDITDLFKELKDKGYSYISNQLDIHKGKGMGAIQKMDIYDIIRFYNSVFRVICSYFGFAFNIFSLIKIWWVFVQISSLNFGLKT